MDIDAIFTLASLVSFLALIAVWIAAPLRAPDPVTVTESAQPASA